MVSGFPCMCFYIPATGHMFAMLDAVQWRHPLVSKPEAHYRTNRNCSTIRGVNHCVPGCPGTSLKRMIASGFNADTRMDCRIH